MGSLIQYIGKTTSIESDDEEDHSDQNQGTTEESPTEDTPMAETQPAQDASDQSDASASHKSMSLRYYLYCLQSQRSDNLFHAIYPSADDKKIFILIYPENQREALHILHGLQEIVATLFEPAASSTYIPMLDGRPPYIPGYPVINNRFKTYASTVIKLSGSNPQDQEDDEVEVIQPPATPKAKRQHTGQMKNPVQSNLPASFSQSTNNVIKMTESMNETTSRLKNLESNHATTQASLKNLHDRLTNQEAAIQQQGRDIATMGTAIESQGNLISTVQETQISQGNSLIRIDGAQTQLLAKVQFLVDQVSQSQAKSPHGSGVPGS